MRFTKMHGLGNDYIYVNAFKETIHNPGLVAAALSERHTGIGSDGLILILPSDTADFKMSMYNSDGTEAEMCGNGIRCVGKYVYDNNMTDKESITVETLAGIKTLELNIKDKKVESIRVDMGEPVLEADKIPVITDNERFIANEIDIEGATLEFTCVSMGNPHAITYVEDIDNAPVLELGPTIEKHRIFPNKVNVEFVKVINREVLKMRVWERGTGETLACGTGACATAVASFLNKLTERNVTVELLGGDLFIEWDEKDNHVYMTGPAVKVYDGEIDISLIDI
jgi:diaminopimelate epimerase